MGSCCRKGPWVLAEFIPNVCWNNAVRKFLQLTQESVPKTDGKSCVLRMHELQRKQAQWPAKKLDLASCLKALLILTQHLAIRALFFFFGGGGGGVGDLQKLA